MLNMEQQEQAPDKEKMGKLVKNSRESFFKEENFAGISKTFKDAPDKLITSIPDIAANVVAKEAQSLGDEHVATIASSSVLLAIEIHETFTDMEWIEPLDEESKPKFIQETMHSSLNVLTEFGNEAAAQALQEIEDLKKNGPSPEDQQQLQEGGLGEVSSQPQPSASVMGGTV